MPSFGGSSTSRRPRRRLVGARSRIAMRIFAVGRHGGDAIGTLACREPQDRRQRARLTAASSTDATCCSYRLRGVELPLKAEGSTPRASTMARTAAMPATQSSAAPGCRPIGTVRRPRPGRRRASRLGWLPGNGDRRRDRPGRRASRSAAAAAMIRSSESGRRLHQRHARRRGRHDATELGELGMGFRAIGEMLADGIHLLVGQGAQARTRRRGRGPRRRSALRAGRRGRRASVMATASPASRAARAASGSSRSRAACPSARRSRSGSARRSRRARCASRWTSVRTPVRHAPHRHRGSTTPRPRRRAGAARAAAHRPAPAGRPWPAADGPRRSRDDGRSTAATSSRCPDPRRTGRRCATRPRNASWTTSSARVASFVIR